MNANDNGPLAGMLVVDLSRMLPGAVLARQLLDLGARLIKVEDPVGGDPMRQVPPLIGGVGLPFAALLHGAESVAVDLRRADGVDAVVSLAARADVVVESFRPGRMEEWGVGEARLRSGNPRLVWCSLPAWGGAGGLAARVGHDLNLSGETGALGLMAADGVPPLQLSDVAGGLLAASAVLAALLARTISDRGGRIEQPLVAGSLPFVLWPWAEEAVGGGGIMATLLGGGVPCYRRYRCGDGRELTVAALEPKFWSELMEQLGLPELAAAGLSLGAQAEEVAGQVAAVFLRHGREHWLELAAERGLPLAAVHSIAEARQAGELEVAGLVREVALTGGGRIDLPGPFLPGFPTPPPAPAPLLGEHTAAVLGELGLAAD